MPYPNPADVAAIAKDPNLTLMSQEGLNIGYWAFNTTKKPLDDKRVRQALNLAVNKKAIIDAVYLGAGAAGNRLALAVADADDHRLEDLAAVDHRRADRELFV